MKYTAHEVMMMIATGAIAVVLLIIVGGLVGLVLILHDGQQTDAIQSILSTTLTTVLGALVAIVGVPRIIEAWRTTQAPLAPSQRVTGQSTTASAEAQQTGPVTNGTVPAPVPASRSAA